MNDKEINLHPIELTHEEIKHISNELSRVLSSLQMFNHYINALPTPANIDGVNLQAYQYEIVLKVLDDFFNQNHDNLHSLDEVIYLLNNSDNEEELNSWRSK